jgi:hypothetical protein
MWKAAANWYKIDGEWYFFLGNGTLATSQFVGPEGDYYVDENGAWVEGVTGGWQEQADGSWKFGLTKDGETTYYAADPEDETLNDDQKAGWFIINGKEYHFDEDGILDTWKVIATPVYEDGKEVGTEIFGVGKNGNKGLVTDFDFKADAKVSTVFKFGSNIEVKNAAEDLKAFFTNVYGDVKKDGPLFTAPFVVGNKTYQVKVERKLETVDAVVNDDGTITPAKQKYVVAVTIEGQDIVEFMAGTKDGNYKDGVVTSKLKDMKGEVAVTFQYNLSKFLGFMRLFSAAGEYDYKIYLGTDTEKAPVITYIALSDTYFNIVVDGVEYQALYTAIPCDENFAIIEDASKAVYAVVDDVYFLGNQAEKLGKVLYNAGVVSGYTVYDTSAYGIDEYGFGKVVASEEYKAPEGEKTDDGVEIEKY